MDHKKQLEKALIDIKKRINDGLLTLKLTEKESELDLLESESREEKFWEDQENAGKVMQKINQLKAIIAPWRKIEKESTHLLDLIESTKEADPILSEIKSEIDRLKTQLNEREIDTYFSGEYDHNNALLSIYAGAGGVDAQDWAEMLLSMYLKYCQAKGLKATVVHTSAGTEAGIKSASVEIEGIRAYGLLKSEGGVHRLVRISPFDADKARHTSFALVEVIPEIEAENIDLLEKDLKIDTFRASGHGGQSVNTTDSAVRVTHLPMGITVNCQNERSQLQNKQTALKILKSRLVAEKKAQADKEIKLIRGDLKSAEWGSQIRSYVLQPYTMVKDHRTNYTESDPQAVLAGRLDPFINAYLKRG